MKHKLVALVFVIIFFPLLFSSITSVQDEIFTDYIIVFDLSYSMFNEIQVTPSDFINCDPALKEKASKEEKAKKVSIGRAAVECYLNNYSRKGDKFALLLIKENPQEGMLVDGFYDNKEEVYQKIRIEEHKDEGYGLTPLSDALWTATEFFHKKGSGNRYKKMLFVTDLYETKKREGKGLCETVSEIRSHYGGELYIDSLLIFVMPIKKENYDEISKCFRENFHIATLIPISTFELSFEFVDSVETLKDLVRDCEYDRSKCEHFKTELEEEVESLREKSPNGMMNMFEIRVLLWMFSGIGIIFILFGLQFFARLRFNKSK